MKTYLSILLSLVLLTSCGDITQEVIISYDGNDVYQFSMDIGQMAEMAEIMGDSLQDSIPADQQDKDQNLDISAIFDDPSKLPDKIDTTIIIGADPKVALYDLTDRERRLLNQTSMSFDIDKSQSKMKVGMSVEYANLEEREEALALMDKIQEGSNSSDTTSSEKSNPSDSFMKSLMDYTVDMDAGIFVVKDDVLPSELKEQAGDNAKDEQFLKFMEMMMPGGIKSRVVLPGRIFRVDAPNHKIINENIVEVTHSWVDLIRYDKIPGFKVEFETIVPITDPKLTEVWDNQPSRIYLLEEDRPSDAIVLFKGTDLDEWEHSDGQQPSWTIENGELLIESGSGDIQTKKKFGDCQLHVEWNIPNVRNPKSGEGHSGVVLAGKYEVQIFDSQSQDNYANGHAGAIYKQHIPSVNVTRSAGEWNVFDIIYHAPRFSEDGEKLSSGTMTVLQNGVVVQDKVEILGTTEHIGRPKTIAHGEDVIILQNHDEGVKFRNIWIRRL